VTGGKRGLKEPSGIDGDRNKERVGGYYCLKKKMCKSNWDTWNSVGTELDGKTIPKTQEQWETDDRNQPGRKKRKKGRA